MKPISAKTSLFSLVESYPELKELLHDFGFKDIVKPGMLTTVGRFMTLEKCIKLIKIPFTELQAYLALHGFLLQE